MPKKFKEVNSKAAEARERKTNSKREAEEKKRIEEEDAYWKIDDKHERRKQDRKVCQQSCHHNLIFDLSIYNNQEDKDRKKQEQLQRKLELKKLAEEEDAQLKTKSSVTTAGGVATKVTRAKIAETKSQEKTSGGATALPRKLSEDTPLMENPNLLLKQRSEDGHHDASTIDEAIAVLSTQDSAMEKHPERRMKAAYTAFEERELPRLKEEYPNLRLSQLKQRLKKEWTKSPDNPMNQSHQMFNSKTD